MLWKASKTELAIIDVENYSNVRLEDFWELKDKKKPVSPQLVIGNRALTKIFGLVYDANNNGYFLHYQQGIQSYCPVQANSGLTLCLSVDLSFNEEFVLAGGLMKEIPALSVLKFRSDYPSVASVKFSKHKSLCLTKVKRIAGSDVVLVAFNYEISVLIYKHIENELVIIHTYSLLGESDVIGLAFHSNALYFIRSNMPELMMIPFRQTIDQQQLHLAGRYR